MDKLLKKKNKGKKKGKKTKKSTKKKTNLFKEEKPVKRYLFLTFQKVEKKAKNEAWGEEEEDGGFIIDYKVKEKKTNENNRPAPVNLENGWKDEEVAIKVKPEEEKKKVKPKGGIQWGDELTKDVNYEQTISDNYFPELGDETAV